MADLYYRTPDGTKCLGSALHYFISDCERNEEIFNRLYLWSGDMGWVTRDNIDDLLSMRLIGDAATERDILVEAIKKFGDTFLFTEYFLDELDVESLDGELW